MAIKELKTRIALKYDLYSAWTSAPGKDLVLLKGELGICEIPSTNVDSNVAPTVLFKVGDGTKTFENLPWASAKAADVYSWAKASDVVYNQAAKTITFVKGNADGTDKVITFNYVTLAEVQEITNGLDTRITALEGKFTGTGSVQSQIDALDGRLDVIEGEAAGSIKKAEADAKAYAKEYADGLAGNYDAAGSAAAAESAAKSHADTEIAKDRKRLDDLETADAAQDTLIAGKLDASVYNTYIAGKEMSDAQLKSYSDSKAAEEAGKAQTAAVTSANGYTDEKVQALANGQVATNKTDIAGLTTRIGNEEAKREEEDGKLSARLDKIETFFVTKKDEEGNDIALDEALDTLVEIQEYITGDGAAAKDMLDAIEANADAIKTLNDTTVPGVKTIAEDAQTRIAAVEPKVGTLESIAKSYLAGGEDAVKKAIDAVSERAEKGITDAATAQSAAEAAQGTANTAVANAKTAQDEVDALELVVAGVKTTADNAKTDLAALTGRVTTAEGKITTAEGKISTLEGIVNDASKGNEKLRTDVNALQTLTGEGGAIELAIADAKKAGTDAAAAVDALSKGQVATNKTDIAGIKADYLKAADEFIFNCGTATTIIHKAEA
jgi:hypothetical protein